MCSSDLGQVLQVPGDLGGPGGVAGQHRAHGGVGLDLDQGVGAVGRHGGGRACLRVPEGGRVMVSLVLLERGLSSKLKWLESVPVVPFAGAFMMALLFVWLAAYIYLLYRKVVADDAKPA